MFRFIGWIWDEREQRQNGLARTLSSSLKLSTPGWQTAFEAPGARIFVTGMRPQGPHRYELPRGSGVVLGVLFQRVADSLSDAPCPAARIGEREAQWILDSKGQKLIDDYWGNYVALLNDRERGSVYVLKDPTGSLPCYTTELHGLTALFSRASDCLDLRLFTFTANPMYLRDRVLGREYPRRDALNEVVPLCGGEGLQFNISTRPMSRRTRLHWRPLEFADRSAAIEDPASAAAMIRATVRSCTHSLASIHESLLLRLSGGLDSSIISACLSDRALRAKVTSYTYYNPRARADERPWAQLAAKSAGIDHLERFFDPRDVDLRRRPALRPSVHVSPLLEHLGRSDLEREMCEALAATAVFSGDGGDSGFCSDSIALALVDYLKRRGLRPDVLRLAEQIALCTHRSTWSVLVTSARRWLRGQTWMEQRGSEYGISQLAHRDLRATRSDDDAPDPHPWFRDCAEPPWSVIRRLGALPNPTSYYDLSIDPDAAAPEVVAPLYAQPAIELFLRIPLDVHFFDGRERGLARCAFSGDVPDPILQRLWKDRPPNFLEQIVDRNRSEIRELLLGGVLVASGLLDRSATEQALEVAPSASRVTAGEVFSHLDTELWARQWLAAPVSFSE